MQKPIRVAPSILAADFANLGDEVKAVTKAGADMIHFDIMDGHFVPNISFGASVMRSLRRLTSLPFDTHFMLSPYEIFIESFIDAGANTITLHAEAGVHIHRSIQLIKDKGLKAGIALNPGTPIEMVEPLLQEVDLVLVMTVNPGFGGQSFIPGQIEKIIALRSMIDAIEKHSEHRIDLEVDGGVTKETAARCVAAGADILVAGSAVFSGGSDAYAPNIDALKP